jgi:hypothetical protein
LRLVLAPDLDRGSASISLAALAAGARAPVGDAAGAATVLAPAEAVGEPKLAASGAVPGTTVPGMSLATSSGSRRSAGVYVAAALGLVMLGAGGTWLALTGRLPGRRASAPPPATAAIIATAVQPAGDVRSAAATSAPPSDVPGLAPPPPPPSAAPAGSASSLAPPHHDGRRPPTPAASGDPAPSSSARPRSAAPRVATPPPHRGGDDQRLGF